MINRRKALTVAGTVAATVAGGTLAIAANFGLLGFARDESSSLGALEADYPLQPAAAIAEDTTSPAEAPTDVIVRYEDILVPADDRDGDATQTSQERTESDESDDDGEDGDEDEATTSSTTTTSEVHEEDDEYEDDEHEDEDHADELDGFEDDD